MKDPERFAKQIQFILEIDKEKKIYRQTHITGYERQENDAEHAWHMAVMLYLLKEYANEEFDLAKAMIMALIHDIVEIDAGDTYAYDEKAKETQKEREKKAADRIFGLLPPEQGAELRALFEEFEAQETPEARIVKTMDNLQPLLLNDYNEGRDWMRHDVSRSMVEKRQETTIRGSQEIGDYALELIAKNVKEGKIREDSRMKLTIGQPKTPFLSEKMFGLFFEDINYAADGGLYAEMLENRQFAFRKAAFGKQEKTYDSTYAGDYGWALYPENGSGRMSFMEGDALSAKNPHFMRFTVEGEAAGFSNKAYDGICMKQGMTCHLTLWIRSGSYADSLTFRILGKDSEEVIAEASVPVTSDTKWQQYQVSLQAKKDVKNGLFTVCQKQGSVDYGYLSCMPEDAVEQVFRKDLFELLLELRPGFLRFPGGCIVEGANLQNRYRWKDTVGPNWDRKWNWNRWAVHDVTMGQGTPVYFPFYNQSYGLGFYEYFLLAEKLGAKPLPVLNVGLACQFQSDELVPVDAPEFQEYLQDAIDLIEFANGDTATTWGKLRAQMGHPKPFGLQYLGIGNEQWESDRVDFFDRYRAFEKAIHAVYPKIRLLGSAGPNVTSEEYTRAWAFYRKEQETNPNFTHAVDEHYYMSPDWFYEHVNMYDTYPRDIPVFAGEYAAHCDRKQNNWEAALAEAAFMCGLEKNADVIRFASAAPLFARKNYIQWIPDTIWFDGDTVMKTPGYYIQQIFGVYTGREIVSYEIEGPEKLYTAVSCDEDYVYIKLVNAQDREIRDLEIGSENGKIRWEQAKVLQISDASLQTENMLGEPEKIGLQELPGKEPVLPAYSCTVIIVPGK